MGLNVVELSSYIRRLVWNEFRRETLQRDHRSFFEDYKGVAKEVVGELDGMLYAVVRDGHDRPRLTADVQERRVLVDVGTATVLTGSMPEPALSFARAVPRCGHANWPDRGGFSSAAPMRWNGSTDSRITSRPYL